MSSFFSHKKINLYSFVFILIVLGLLAYFQYVKNIPPCFLNFLERISLLALALLFLTANLVAHNKLSQKIFSWVTFIPVLLGLIFTERHIWLQYKYPMLKPSAHFFNPHFNVPNISSVKQFFLLVYTGGSYNACSMSWKWKGISISEFTMGVFILLTLVCLWQILRKNRL